MKHLSDTKLVQRHEAISTQLSKLNAKLCDQGLGCLKFSEIRLLVATNKTCARYVELTDESMSLRYEAESRYGPGMMTVRQLLWRDV